MLPIQQNMLPMHLCRQSSAYRTRPMESSNTSSVLLERQNTRFERCRGPSIAGAHSRSQMTATNGAGWRLITVAALPNTLLLYAQWRRSDGRYNGRATMFLGGIRGSQDSILKRTERDPLGTRTVSSRYFLDHPDPCALSAARETMRWSLRPRVVQSHNSLRMGFSKHRYYCPGNILQDGNNFSG
jgi:hypothetical protein